MANRVSPLGHQYSLIALFNWNTGISYFPFLTILCIYFLKELTFFSIIKYIAGYCG